MNIKKSLRIYLVNLHITNFRPKMVGQTNQVRALTLQSGIIV